MAKVVKYKEFVDNNKEALQLLSEKIKVIDTVDGIDHIEEALGRQYAKSIVSEWLTELWGITTEQLPEVDEEDEIYRTIE